MELLFLDPYTRAPNDHSIISQNNLRITSVAAQVIFRKSIYLIELSKFVFRVAGQTNYSHWAMEI